ncbi:ArsR/SmtB family transcription factor [Actinoalloteichus hymeniacidonis]|uniref:Transcriptional regulator n=1 Tax=Actinoalloteichus hymeniacidonis TaxID=340345 RepID=A0AAC9HWE9_9PSEU|nr:helix-turn-helix domain-containing protein [Actinoalloteichus hymeniacidonis]AOS65705.1 putative transcriptional regulator [Actinoalloteichus hymeniacidonis]MBB5906205.1 DNA-binding transcriptional ArsR family regulator [Actinoalloteichus hymeniacidonis]
MVTLPGNNSIDVSALRALAHPLRITLIQELGIHGPATASQLGRRLGETSGATSYHLRQLARHGLIEDDDERSAGRERWWRRKESGFALAGFEFMRKQETRAAAQLVIREFQRGKDERLRRWLEGKDRWSDEWYQASMDSTVMMRLNPALLFELTSELVAVIERYRGRSVGDDAESVELQLNAFPNPPLATDDGMDGPAAGTGTDHGSRATKQTASSSTTVGEDPESAR